MGRHGAVVVRRRHARSDAPAAQEFPAVGVCLQAYLFRTREDLEDITSRGIGVRLVKGAYNEPATVAFPKKSDVDANYFALAQLMLAPGGPRRRRSRRCSAPTISI